MKHRYIEHVNCEREFCYICQGGLSICATCGLAEGALTDDCPGVRIPEYAERASYEGRLNFRDGAWCDEPNTLGWADARVGKVTRLTVVK
jgi:hypothetical protein